MLCFPREEIKNKLTNLAGKFGQVHEFFELMRKNQREREGEREKLKGA